VEELRFRIAGTKVIHFLFLLFLFPSPINSEDRQRSVDGRFFLKFRGFANQSVKMSEALPSAPAVCLPTAYRTSIFIFIRASIPASFALVYQEFSVAVRLGFARPALRVRLWSELRKSRKRLTRLLSGAGIVLSSC
jgi:hypothetical protein